MYCVVEVYQEFLRGDFGPFFSEKPDYSTQFLHLEDAEEFCRIYNEKYKNTWPKLHPHLMTDEDIKYWEKEQEYEHEMWDNYGI